MKKYFILLTALFVLAAHPCFALDLKEAKSKGLVGETITGYLAPVKKTPEVEKLIAEINAKRKAMYEKIAKKNKTSLAAVEKLAGKKAIEKTPPGQYINLGKGWIKKKK
jgi:uncharacterized protein YdbL (DUF1318 family)